jgi:membrane-bound lytic murein transglycosylase A
MLLLCLLAACAPQTQKPLADAPEFRPVSFASLPAWHEDATQAAFVAFLKSCAAMQMHADSHIIGVGPAAGPARWWKDVCSRGRDLPTNDSNLARHYFERYFLAFKVVNHGDSQALFTGYYEPLVHGSRERSERYYVPIYRLPDEKKEGVPFYDRADIDAGVLAHKGLELVWLDDPIDAYFLQVQGSGKVALDDGTYMTIGYAGRNDQPYVPIGRILAERGAISPENISMQSIQEWLRAHPDQARQVMEENPSYIFFREIPADEPLGSQNVPLTPYRSVAVDPRYIPLGAPVYVDTVYPPTSSAPLTIKRSLMIAQDTGSAIRGPARADIYFGAGPEAEELAGLMHSGGEMYVFLPRNLVISRREAQEDAKKKGE